MLTSEIHTNRLENIRALLKEKKVDAFVTFSRENIFYMTGFTGSSGMFFVSADQSVLFTDSRYSIQSKKEVKDSTIIIYKKQSDAYDMINDMKGETIGFCASNISFYSYRLLKKSLNGWRLKDCKKLVERLRQVKDNHELSVMKSAIRKATRSLEATLKTINERIDDGITELDIKCILESEMRRNGAEKESFDTIVLSGRNSALVHGRSSGKKLKRGELILIDYGVRYKNYCSDETRTFVIGEASQRQKDIYEVVSEAQRLAISELRDGVCSKHIDSIARDHIKKCGYGDHFLHGLGHSLGIEVHESPSFTPTYDYIVKEGMVLTVEPGIYIENFGGIRIEDMVYITKTGSKVLTCSPSMLSLS